MLPDVEHAAAMTRCSRPSRSPRPCSQAFDLTPHEAADVMGREMAVLAQSNDHKVGVAAFAARTEPQFTRS